MPNSPTSSFSRSTELSATHVATQPGATPAAPAAPAAPSAPADSQSGADTSRLLCLDFSKFRIAAITAFVLALSATCASWVLKHGEVRTFRSTEVLTSLVTVNVDSDTASSIRVLGLNSSEQKLSKTSTASIEVPVSHASLIAAVSSSKVHGLVFIPAHTERLNSYTIDSNSTAQALAILAPGVLESDIAGSYDRVVQSQTTPQYQHLVEVLSAADFDLGHTDPGFETAFGQYLSALAQSRGVAEISCDSSDLYSSAGICLNRTVSTSVLSNSSRRWVLLYNSKGRFDQFCALLGPSGTALGSAEVDSGLCGDELLLAAPGVFGDVASSREVLSLRAQGATLVDIYASYTSPFVDLAGSAVGHNSDSVSILKASDVQIIDYFSELIKSNEQVHQASLAGIEQSSLPAQIEARTVVTNALINASREAPLIPNRSSMDNGYLELLNFYNRVASSMSLTESTWLYDYDAIEIIGLEP